MPEIGVVQVGTQNVVITDVHLQLSITRESFHRLVPHLQPHDCVEFFW
jgi:hypothetical protein